MVLLNVLSTTDNRYINKQIQSSHILKGLGQHACSVWGLMWVDVDVKMPEERLAPLERIAMLVENQRREEPEGMMTGKKRTNDARRYSNSKQVYAKEIFIATARGSLEYAVSPS